MRLEQSLEESQKMLRWVHHSSLQQSPSLWVCDRIRLGGRVAACWSCPFPQAAPNPVTEPEQFEEVKCLSFPASLSG